MSDKKIKYVVRPGFRFGSYNEIGPGEVVELTAEEAAGVLDKLEPAGKAKTAAPSGQPPEDKSKTDPPADGNPDNPPPIDPVIAKAVELAGVEAPEELSLLSDEDLRAVQGIGRAVLKKIRQEFPYTPPEED